MHLIEAFRNRFGNIKDIWLWTGYYIGEIPQTSYTTSIMRSVDYIVDGPYVEEYSSTSLRYRGSWNQTIYKRGDDYTFTAIE